MTIRAVIDSRTGIVHWSDWSTRHLFSIALCDTLLIRTDTEISDSSVTCDECNRIMRERIEQKVNINKKSRLTETV
jgi:hypothetical protein